MCAAGAVGNILLMMAANLVGFVLGADGIKYLLAQLVGTAQGASAGAVSGTAPSLSVRAGWQFLAVACGVIFMVVQLMFEYRCVLPVPPSRSLSACTAGRRRSARAYTVGFSSLRACSSIQPVCIRFLLVGVRLSGLTAQEGDSVAEA